MCFLAKSRHTGCIHCTWQSNHNWLSNPYWCICSGPKRLPSAIEETSNRSTTINGSRPSDELLHSKEQHVQIKEQVQASKTVAIDMWWVTVWELGDILHQRVESSLGPVQVGTAVSVRFHWQAGILFPWDNQAHLIQRYSSRQEALEMKTASHFVIFNPFILLYTEIFIKTSETTQKHVPGSSPSVTMIKRIWWMIAIIKTDLSHIHSNAMVRTHGK